MKFARVNQAGPAAFSLVEVMVAVGLLSVLIVGLLAMFYQTQKAFRLGVGQVDVMESGRLFTEMIGRELQQTVASGESNVVNIWFRQNPDSIPTTQPLPGGTVQDRTNRLFDLYFLRKENDFWVGTAYRVSTPELGAGSIHKLEEALPRRELADLNALFVANKLDSPTALAIGDDPAMSRFIDGVVHFRLTAYDRQGYLMSTNTLDGSVIAQEEPAPLYRFRQDELPAYIDLELGILEAPVYATFRARPDPVKGAFLTQQSAKVHLFRKRIPIRAAP